MLPAFIEITLAAGDLTAARDASSELESLAEGRERTALGATAAQARGTVDWPKGEPAAALIPLRHAGQVWLALDAPYEAARVRELVSLACRALGDKDTAALELDAARVAYEGLSAMPDLARIASLARVTASSHGLTKRELEVLRLVAAGKTNRAIAAELVVSDRTVDRHVSNIFTKLHVSSRAAATAAAYERGLV